MGRRFHHFLAILALGGLIPGSGVAGNAAGPAIRAAEGGWGRAETAEVEIVLKAVADELVPRSSPRLARGIVVEHGAGDPLTWYPADDGGPFRVRLSAADRRWAQYAYQFGHELCHILSNFERHAGTGHASQWFEESLCEAAALHVLERLAVAWQAAPPDPDWAGYAPAFRDYALALSSEPHRRLPAGMSAGRWLQENLSLLQRNPYRRDRNEVVANLLLPLLEGNPAGGAALAGLNLGARAEPVDFTSYLRDWHDHVPEAQRTLVRQVQSLFRMPPDAPAKGGADGAGAEHPAY